MVFPGRILDGALDVAAACAPGAAWAGGQLVRLTDWVDTGRGPLTGILDAA